MNPKCFTPQLLVIGILLLAFFLRLAYLAEIRQLEPDHTIFCGGDAQRYDANAQAALTGAWPGDQPFGLMPLYSYYLFGLYRLFGVNYLIPLIGHMLLEVVTCAAVFAIGTMAFSRLSGLLAALAVAIYGPLIFFQVCYAQALLTTPLLVLAFFFLFKGVASGQARYGLAAGAALGVCALSRPTMLALGPIFLLWLFWHRTSLPQFGRQSVWFMLALSLTLAPATFHNYQVTGRFILISDLGPLNLYLGNNQYANEIGPHGVAEQYGQRLGEVFVFPTEFSEVKTAVAAGETTYQAQALAYVAEQPGDWLELTRKKAALMVFEPDWKFVGVSFDYAGSGAALMESWLLRLFPIDWPALVVAGILAGIVVPKRRYTGLLLLTILSVSAITILFFVQFRFRLPLVPFWLLLISSLVTSGRVWFQQSRPRFGIVLLVLLALFPFQPGLLIVIVLYLLVGLFPHPGSRISLGQLGWPAAALWSYVVIAGFGLSMINLRQADSQTQDYFTGPEIWGPISVGQSFAPECNGLNRIEVELSRLSFTHNQPTYFHLVKNLEPDDEIYTTQFKVDQVSRWTRLRFTFPPQPESAHQTYLFYLNSPDASPGNSITVRLYPDLPTVYRRYEPGSIYAGSEGNLQPFPGDLAFAAYCQEPLLELIFRTLSHLAGLGPDIIGYPGVYAGFLILHGLILIISLLKLLRSINRFW